MECDGWWLMRICPPKGAYAKYKMYRYICVQEADQRSIQTVTVWALLVYRFT